MPHGSLSIPGRPRPWVMAHRGASDRAPENSLAAFRLAAEHGADLIETDLWLTADRGIACHHDETAARMAGDPRKITAMSRDDLARLRLRDPTGRFPDEPIPTLDSLLGEIPAEVRVVLELKDRRFGERWAADRLVEALGPRVRDRTAAVICDDLGLVRRVRDLVPGLIIGHIALRNPLGARDVDLLGPWWPHLWINPWYVRIAHRRGQRVCPLDPDLHRRLPQYLAMDVDAVLTNDPLQTRRLIESLRGAG